MDNQTRTGGQVAMAEVGGKRDGNGIRATLGGGILIAGILIAIAECRDRGIVALVGPAGVRAASAAWALVLRNLPSHSRIAGRVKRGPGDRGRLTPSALAHAGSNWSS